MAASDAPRLPSEIIAQIITFSDYPTLAALLRVSTSTFHLAASRLYRYLNLSSGRRLLPFIPPRLLSPYYRRILATPEGWENSTYSKTALLRLTTRLDVDEDYEIDPDDVIIPHGGLSGNPLPNLKVLAIGSVTSTWDLHIRCEGDHLGFYEQLRPTTLIVTGIDGNQSTDRPAKCVHTGYKTGIPQSVTRLVLCLNTTEWLEHKGILRLWYDDLHLDTSPASACQVRESLINFSALLTQPSESEYTTTSLEKRGQWVKTQPWSEAHTQNVSYLVQRSLMRGSVIITGLDRIRTVNSEEITQQVREWMPTMEKGVLEGIMGKLRFERLEDVEAAWGIGGYL